MTAVAPHAFDSATHLEQELFSTGEIAALLGISYYRLDYWVQCKLILPNVRAASGRGSRRLFSRDNLQQFLLVKRLHEAGWKPKQIAPALSAVTAAFADPTALQAPCLIHEDNRFLILCWKKGDGPVLVDAASPGQHVLVIALEALREETLQSLARSK